VRERQAGRQAGREREREITLFEPAADGDDCYISNKPKPLFHEQNRCMVLIHSQCAFENDVKLYLLITD